MNSDAEDKLADMLSIAGRLGEQLGKLETAEKRVHALARSVRDVRRKLGMMILDEDREKGGEHEAVPE